MQSISVLDYGCVGDGRNDDSPGVQRAVDSAAETGGNVFMPAGLYRLCKGINVPVGVNIEGTTHATTGPWQNFLDSQDKNGNGNCDLPFLSDFGEKWLDKGFYKGTWILVDHGENDINSCPTFNMSGNTSIKKIGFVHRRLPPITNEITPYPPAIGFISNHINKFTRDGVAIEDISLANCYYGIAFVIGEDLECDYIEQGETVVSVSAGRHRAHNIMGGPLYNGILIKGMLDTIDINNVQFNYTCYEKNYIDFRTHNCIDFKIIRADGLNFTNILSFGAYTGIQTEPGFTNKNVSLRATNLNLEAVKPLRFLANGMYEISNSYFLTINFTNSEKFSEFCNCEIRSDERCIHQSFYIFSNCFFQRGINLGEKNENITSDFVLDINLLSGANVQLNGCMFWGWDRFLKYTHNKNGGASCNIANSTFTSPQFNGTLFLAEGDSLNNNELVFSNCRIPTALSIKNENKIALFNNCTVYDNDGETNIYGEPIFEV